MNSPTILSHFRHLFKLFSRKLKICVDTKANVSYIENVERNYTKMTTTKTTTQYGKQGQSAWYSYDSKKKALAAGRIGRVAQNTGNPDKFDSIHDIDVVESSTTPEYDRNTYSWKVQITWRAATEAEFVPARVWWLGKQIETLAGLLCNGEELAGMKENLEAYRAELAQRTEK